MYTWISRSILLIRGCTKAVIGDIMETDGRQTKEMDFFVTGLKLNVRRNHTGG